MATLSRLRTGSLLPAAMLLALAACEFPTEIPQFEQTWVIPADSTSVLVDELLPPGFSVVSGAFAFTPAPVTVGQNLVGAGGMCGTCISSGAPQPKPPFTASVSVNVGTGPDILQGNLTAGNTFRVTLTHNFTFDPIRPSAVARGFVVIELSRGGVVIGRDSVSGNNRSWAASPQSLQMNIPLTAGVSLAGGTPIVVSATVNSPAGDPVVMNTSHRMDVTASPSNLGITNVIVRVAAKPVSAVNVALDLDDIEDEMAERITGGGFLFTIANPFQITGSLTLTINAPGGGPITKPLAITSAATSTADITFSQEDLQRIIGASGVTMSLSGTVSGTQANNGVSIAPGQRLGLATRVRMTIRVGG